MNGCIVTVWFCPESEYAAGRSRFLVIETDCVDFDEFCQAVHENGLIRGTILHTRKSLTESNGMEFTRHRPCLFRGDAVHRCEEPQFRYVEMAEAE